MAKCYQWLYMLFIQKQKDTCQAFRVGCEGVYEKEAVPNSPFENIYSVI